MTLCELRVDFAAIILAPAIMYAAWALLRGIELSVTALPRAREQAVSIQYASVVADAARYTEDPLRISRRGQGGPPWFPAFPLETTRQHVERLYDVGIIRKELPTEKNMIANNPNMTRKELQAIRDHMLRHGWAEYVRAGDHAAWQLTERGQEVVTTWYGRLTGREYVKPQPKKPEYPDNQMKPYVVHQSGDVEVLDFGCYD